MPKVCNMDCFNCKFDDCIKDDVYREASRYCNMTEHSRQYIKDYHKKRSAEAKKKGYCTTCCIRPATHGTKCEKCYQYSKSYYQNKKGIKRILWQEEGKCYICGDSVKEGYKLCEKHYQVSCKNLESPKVQENREKLKKRHYQRAGVKFER